MLFNPFIKSTTAVVLCLGFSSLGYANPVDDSQELLPDTQHQSKKRTALSQLSSEEPKKVKPNPEVLQPSALSQLFTRSDFRDISSNILQYTRSIDRDNLALVGRDLLKSVRMYQMKHDPHKMGDRKWVGGPEIGTVQNYKFNQIIWKIQEKVLDIHDQKKTVLSKPNPRLRIKEFYVDKWPSLKSKLEEGIQLLNQPDLKGFVAVPSILMVLNAVMTFFSIKNPKKTTVIVPLDFKNLCKKPETNRSERQIQTLVEFISSGTFDLKNSSYYDKPQTDNDRSVLENHLESMQLRADLQKSSLSVTERAEKYNLLVRYSINLSIQDYDVATLKRTHRLEFMSHNLGASNDKTTSH